MRRLEPFLILDFFKKGKITSISTSSSQRQTINPFPASKSLRGSIPNLSSNGSDFNGQAKDVQSNGTARGPSQFDRNDHKRQSLPSTPTWKPMGAAVQQKSQPAPQPVQPPVRTPANGQRQSQASSSIMKPMSSTEQVRDTDVDDEAPVGPFVRAPRSKYQIPIAKSEFKSVSSKPQILKNEVPSIATPSLAATPLKSALKKPIEDPIQMSNPISHNEKNGFQKGLVYSKKGLERNKNI